jgi:hypothetical protein
VKGKMHDEKVMNVNLCWKRVKLSFAATHFFSTGPFSISCTWFTLAHESSRETDVCCEFSRR